MKFYKKIKVNDYAYQMIPSMIYFITMDLIELWNKIKKDNKKKKKMDNNDISLKIYNNIFKVISL